MGKYVLLETIRNESDQLFVCAYTKDTMSTIQGIRKLCRTFQTDIGLQWTFSGTNTDGSFTTAVSNSYLSPLEQNLIAADLG